jgi:hypothetical protein
VLLALVAAVAVITLSSQQADTSLAAKSDLAALQAKYNCAYCSAHEIHQLASLQARIGARSSAMSPPPDQFT